MTQTTGPDDSARQRAQTPPSGGEAGARASVVASMVSASLFAVVGTLMFAWALRTPEYSWLFFVGALPWVVGIVMFARAFWRYTRS